MGTFDFRSDLTPMVTQVGQSREPVLIIDTALADTGSLMDAAAHATWTDLPPGGYPGQRAGLPRDYVRAVLQALNVPIRDTLLHGPRNMGDFTCSFSMVTRTPRDLTPLQRVPHIDVANPNRIAILHYLCDEPFGGTAFFRQNATGFEQITPNNKAAYVQARAEDLKALEPDHIYPGPNTPGYTRTHVVDAAFNRLIAYRSCTLHSGVIGVAEMLSGDPLRGRLTANFFVDFVAP